MFSIWLAGRVSMNATGLIPGGIVAAIDLAFVPILGILAARQLFVKPAPRNLVFLLMTEEERQSLGDLR